ncbi:MAG: leucine--tRNA ligase [Thaumarchaeota archaeon]|nr:leucine--tRNA ligase [Nitrososphaerota archaeon]
MVDWASIESKWRERWRGTEVAHADASREKRFITVAYPYPNSPQHIGHGRTYTLADVHARFERMRGRNVLFPMAFHYTGTPILGMAERIESGDEGLISGLVDLYGVPRERIPEFADPVKIARYFHEEIRSGMVEMGYSIDWSGEFTTIDPAYKKFIAWQVRLLRERGVIVQGSHPVGWCPRDSNPVSQHDTRGDVEPDFVEYTIVRLALEGGRVLPAATMRPETVYGVTNAWVNPDMEYARVRVAGAEWLVAPECISKLSHLDAGPVESTGTSVRGADLVGLTARVPGVDRDVRVLPATFVRADVGTGAVMSVPAHAPYDCAALEDLRRAGGEAGEIARSIRPVQIIQTEGRGEDPAGELVAAAGVASQGDERLEGLTKDLYAAEYYGGTMLPGTGSLAGMPAREAKEAAAEWLAGEQRGPPEAMYEFSNAPIFCRCGTACVVHVLSNQWFIDYSSAEWKALARRALGALEVVPPEMRPEFEHVFGWLRERACARQTGLGTALPWDGGWTVESLSDSVIYMSYYVVSRFVNAGRLDPESLDDAFFDHVLLGRGSAREAAASCGADEETVAEVRSEFEYFYPVDSRHSGRDLVPNHLSFFVFNHALVFPERHWPRQIVVNGSVLMEGKKMSKSMSNIIPLRQAVREHGADPIRLAILSSAELLQDADFKLDLVRSSSRQLESMISECARIGSGGGGEASPADEWLGARVRETAGTVSSLIERMPPRAAVRHVMAGLDADLAWHARRAAPSGGGAVALREAWAARAALLSPFAPHAADEMWESLGMDGTASSSAWPGSSARGDDAALLLSELAVASAMSDIQRILRSARIGASRVTLHVAGQAKSRAHDVMLRAAEGGAADIGSMMRALGADPGAAAMRRDAAFVKRTLSDILSATPRERRLRLEGDADEAAAYRSGLAPLVAHELGAELVVLGEGEGGGPKAASARPFKPAILVE